MVQSKTDDLRVEALIPLVAPVILMEQIKPDEADLDFVQAARNQAEAILKGADDRLLAIVGPCSIHDSAAALDYAARLKKLADHYRGELQIVMRVYFEKPRTTVGWKGFINDPDLDESFDINKGLRLGRELLLKINRLGIAAGTEFLDTITPQYIADLVAWGAIGARTTESQSHRQLASGLSMPVGFKNGTAGSISIAVDAIGAARHPHHFLSVRKEGDAAIVKTKGNDTCHIILRGGKSGPNYSADAIAAVVAQLESAGLPAYVMVDCSHGNSDKDHNKQPAVADDLARQIESGSRAITGVMLESNLVAGSQKVIPGEDLVYGQSITDACMGWEATEEVLERPPKRCARVGLRTTG
ncbi:MAG: 3-deoxy-7-phosphoheptulonate synthase [Verrucomicrobiales bacterium]